MNNSKMILIGAGGHSRACIDVIEAEGRYTIAGIIGKPAEIGKSDLGYRVIGSDDDLPVLIERFRQAHIAVGQIKSSSARSDLYAYAVSIGFQFPVIVSPSAYVARRVQLGSGSIIMHGAIVNAGVRIGENCIINSCSLVEHDVSVGDNCHISTGAVVNGGVRIGDGTFLGSGSVVREGVQIGRGCVVGMGVAVRRDIPDGERFIG